MSVAIMQTGINHHGKRQAAMNITSKLNTINAPVNIDTSFFIISRCKYIPYLSQNAGHPSFI
jgi:hypothetical protein